MAKGVKSASLSSRSKRKDSALGRRLVAGLSEALAHARGEIELPSYTVTVPDRVDVAKLRRRLGLSQSGFTRIRPGRDRDPCLGARPPPSRPHRAHPARRHCERAHRRAPCACQAARRVRRTAISNYGALIRHRSADATGRPE